MKKGLIALLVFAATVGMMLPFFEPNGTQRTERPIVTVTTYPLYEAVRQVGGEAVELKKIIPFGTDIHTYRPSPKEMAAISRSSLFIYSGAGLEPWCEQTVAALQNREAVIDMSDHVALLRRDEAAHAEHGHEAHEEELPHHEHGGIDPHYWLDIDNMIAMSEQVRLRLSALLPEQAGLFETNAARFVRELELLKRLYAETLKGCKKRHLVSNHDAFGYLAHKYRFESAAVTGLSPDEQPSAKAMAELTELIEHERIGTIFFEAFVSDLVTQSLARECGVKAQSLQPLANLTADEAASGANYLTIMQSNLDKIADALECR